MKKVISLIGITLAIGISFYIWNTAKVVNISDEFVDEIFIGEAFQSKDIYIEPFSKERGSYDEIIGNEKVPNSIDFYPFEKLDVLHASNPTISSIYIPNREEDSMYFSQEFSQPEQLCLKYKSDSDLATITAGIVVINHQITKVNYVNKGFKRNYTEEEYKLAQSEVEEDNAIDESLRTLEPITLDDTIIGAVQICSLEIEDMNVKMIVSKYETHGAEYAGTVYVIDFVSNEKVIRTIKKYNSDGPY